MLKRLVSKFFFSQVLKQQYIGTWFLREVQLGTF